MQFMRGTQERNYNMMYNFLITYPFLLLAKLSTIYYVRELAVDFAQMQLLPMLDLTSTLLLRWKERTTTFVARNLRAMILYLLTVTLPVTKPVINTNHHINKTNNKLFYSVFVSNCSMYFLYSYYNPSKIGLLFFVGKHRVKKRRH